MRIQMHIICICIYISYSISFYSLDSPYKSPTKYLIFIRMSSYSLRYFRISLLMLEII